MCFKVLFLSLMPVIQSGRILVWCPATSKSVKITFMPIVETLANRGHEVFLVTPFLSKENIDGVTEIQAVSNFDEIITGFAR